MADTMDPPAMRCGHTVRESVDGCAGCLRTRIAGLEAEAAEWRDTASRRGGELSRMERQIAELVGEASRMREALIEIRTNAGAPRENVWAIAVRGLTGGINVGA